ncbi:MAG: hypothetical protein K2J90_08545 [Lachnospiraceae bacterium]|nr:hypothetical protein [Lachnospiraceae bacterium]
MMGTTPGRRAALTWCSRIWCYSLYSRDLFHKVESAVEIRMKHGEYIGSYGFFGYRKGMKEPGAVCGGVGGGSMGNCGGSREEGVPGGFPDSGASGGV